MIESWETEDGGGERIRQAQAIINTGEDGDWGGQSQAALAEFCQQGQTATTATTTTRATTTTAPATTTTRATTTTAPRRARTTMGDWTIEVRGVNRNANRAIKNENMFNADPAAGGTYVLVEIAVTNNGPSKNSTWGEIDFKAITPSGQTHGTCSGFLVLPNEYSAYDDQFPNSTLIGNICLEVPTGAARTINLLIEEGGLFGNESRILELP